MYTIQRVISIKVPKINSNLIKIEERGRLKLRERERERERKAEEGNLRESLHYQQLKNLPDVFSNCHVKT